MELNWISVTDALPTSVDREVLVSTPRYTAIASYWNQIGVWIDPAYGDCIHGVTDWAILPPRPVRAQSEATSGY